MIYLKGLTTAYAYDQKGKYLQEIHRDIKKITDKLREDYDFYQFYVAHQKNAKANLSVCLAKGKWRMTFAHFFKIEVDHFEEASSFGYYVLIRKGRDFNQKIKQAHLDQMSHPKNLQAQLLTVFPIIIMLSDSSTLHAYSMNIANLSFIDGCS
ncbi:hypothetical protein [Listeria costaricensis]|uniref:hypothetical protein n=1 Tax=Listeria costaricensis TaxID=2026604 RepID=UPI000C06E43F|nr:hypothetical protein [Listeria costaricensis]